MDNGNDSASTTPAFFSLEVIPGRATVGIETDGQGNAQPREVSVLLDIRPKPVVTADTRDLDLCVVLDVSGSMGMPATPFDHSDAAFRTSTTTTGKIDVRALEQAFARHRANTKLAVCKWALASIVEGLVPGDRSALITFSDEPELICSHEQMGTSQIADFNRRLGELVPESGTRFTEAMQMAIAHFDGSTRDDEKVVVLFTDGESSGGRVRKEEDQSNMLRLARDLRTKGIRLLIYATGESYDKDFLEELAACAGDGSYLYHAQTPAQMPAHLQAAVNDVRGAAINNLTLEIVPFRQNPPVRILEAWQCTPVLKRLEPNEHGHLNIVDGVLSISRGQQIWMRLEIEQPQEGQHPVFGYSVAATRATTGETTKFENFFYLTMSKTRQSSEKRPVFMMAGFIGAHKAAREGKLELAADLFRQIERPELAEEMDKLHAIMQQGGFGAEDAHRTATTLCGHGGMVSHWTMVHV